MQGKGLICEGHLLKLTNASRTKRTQQPNQADKKIEAWHPLTIQKRVVVSTCVCVCIPCGVVVHCKKKVMITNMRMCGLCVCKSKGFLVFSYPTIC